MTAKPTREVDALDLAIDTRRGTLAAEDRRMFEQALSASAALRTAFEIGCDFDLASRIRAGDEALVARVAERALARGIERQPRRLRFAGMLLAASLVMASAAAATRAVLQQRAAEQASLAAPPAPSPGSNARGPVARTTAVASAALPIGSAESSAERRAKASVAPLATSRLPPPATTLVGREPSPPSSAVLPASEDTPGLLLQRAGAARRASELGTARALYLDLQTRFPGSNEARVSYVSLGKLLLAAGRAREADAAFASYLSGGTGELREEALVGQADALFALGRAREENRVRQELIRLYPSSVYATRARERVVQIERAQSAGSP